MLHCCETRPEKARRVVSLHADEATQEKLRQWCIDAGFDLGWNYDGWPIDPDYFRFHVTLLATKNEVEIEDRWQPIGPLTVSPAGFAVLGADRRVPVLTLEQHPKLTAMRQFFIDAFGAEPTFPEYQPHISLSYKWDGAPDLSKVSPPTFPLVFDALVVAVLEGKTKSKDAAMRTSVAMSFADALQIGGTRRTSDGYLVADVRAARTGIQQYLGSELGRPDLQTVNVYRPAEEVFKTDSLASYAHKPVTFGHPQDGVTAATWKQLAVGNVGGDVVRDGGFVRVPLVIMDAQSIQAVEDGTRELSMGYECRLEFTDGVTPEGESYQAVQRDIRINHAAIVERGRAGHQCRIGDKGKPDDRSRQPAIEGNSIMSLRKITIDGLTIEVTDQGAEAISKLQKQVSDAATALTTAQQALADANTKASKDAADHTKALADAAAKIPTVDQLEAMFEKRGSVIDVAKVLLPDLDPKGKSLADVRKAVVAKQLGDDAVKDKDDAAIAPMFDTLAALAKKGGGQADLVRDALKGGVSTAVGDAEKARQKHLDEQSKAWAA